MWLFLTFSFSIDFFWKHILEICLWFWLWMRNLEKTTGSFVSTYSFFSWNRCHLYKDCNTQEIEWPTSNIKAISKQKYIKSTLSRWWPLVVVGRLLDGNHWTRNTRHWRTAVGRENFMDGNYCSKKEELQLVIIHCRLIPMILIQNFVYFCNSLLRKKGPPLHCWFLLWYLRP